MQNLSTEPAESSKDQEPTSEEDQKQKPLDKEFKKLEIAPAPEAELPPGNTQIPDKYMGTFHYRTLEQFEKNEEASAGFKEKKNFSSDIEIVRKKSNSLQTAEEKKFRNDWFLKKRTVNYPLYEVIASEIARLVAKGPKTRWLTKDGIDYVLSKKVDGFKNFTQLKAEEGEAIKKKILNGTYKGFVELLVVNLFTEELDPKTDNIGIDEEGWAMMVDREWSFTSISIRAEKGLIVKNRGDYSVEDIKQLPFFHLLEDISFRVANLRPIDQHYEPINYFDTYRREVVLLEKSEILDQAMKEDPLSLFKKYSAMLKLALIPEPVWYNLVKSYLPKEFEVKKYEKLLQFLYAAKKKMSHMLMLVNPGFVLSQEAKEIFDQFKVDLSLFTTTRKRPLCSVEMINLLDKEFGRIKSDALEHQKKRERKSG